MQDTDLEKGMDKKRLGSRGWRWMSGMSGWQRQRGGGEMVAGGVWQSREMAGGDVAEQQAAWELGLEINQKSKQRLQIVTLEL